MSTPTGVTSISGPPPSHPGGTERARPARGGGPVDPRLLRRAAPVRRQLVLTSLIGVATAAATVGTAWFSAQGIGGVVESRSWAPAAAAALPLALLIVVRAGLVWAQSVLATRTSASVKAQLRTDLLAARAADPIDATGPAPVSSGELITLVNDGMDALDGWFARYLPQLVLAATVPFVVLAAVWSADWISALIIACTVPLIPVFMVLVGLVTEHRRERRWQVQSRLAHHFADLVDGLPTLQVFRRAHGQLEGLRRTEEANRSETLSLLRVAFLSALVLELLATLSVALVAVGIGLRVVEGHLDLTTALFVLILAPEAYLPLRQVGVHYHDSVTGRAAADQALTLLDAAAVRRSDGDRPVPDLGTATVEFVDVGVRRGEGWVVRHVDLVLRPGELVALTGPSGAGKSTLLLVLLGLLVPDEGQVLVGGADLATLDPRAWRAQLAWVAQDPALVRGTIGENVRLGAPDAPASRVRAALVTAGTDLDPDRPMGIDADELSAGERRRVALARALLRVDCGGGRLLVLDEPTAGLDADAERRALAGVHGLGVTTLMVSHRRQVLAGTRTVALGVTVR